MAKIKLGLALVISLIFLPKFCLASTTSLTSIFISQIQITGGKNNTDNDFVEFFNASTSPVNLKGCRLVKRPSDADSDTLVKSWSKDTFIPAKSFYLWANSGYVTIGAKPDVISSATISDNSGVALRFGAVNTGEILDEVSWGKTSNGFDNVSSANPGAGNALIRTDLYQDQSSYFIGASNPRNSSVNDLAAAFDATEESDEVGKKNDNPSTTSTGSGTLSSSWPVGNNNQPVVKQTEPAPVIAASDDNAPALQVEGDDVVAATSSANEQNSEAVYPAQNNPTNQNSKEGAVKYLILSGAALLALAIIAKKSLFNKRK